MTELNLALGIFTVGFLIGAVWRFTHTTDDVDRTLQGADDGTHTR